METCARFGEANNRFSDHGGDTFGRKLTGRPQIELKAALGGIGQPTLRWRPTFQSCSILWRAETTLSGSHLLGANVRDSRLA